MIPARAYARVRCQAFLQRFVVSNEATRIWVENVNARMLGTVSTSNICPAAVWQHRIDIRRSRGNSRPIVSRLWTVDSTTYGYKKMHIMRINLHVIVYSLFYFTFDRQPGRSHHDLQAHGAARLIGFAPAQTAASSYTASARLLSVVSSTQSKWHEEASSARPEQPSLASD